MGRRGLGKSTLAEKKARELNRNLLVFDPNNQFKDANVTVSEPEDLEKELDKAGGEDDEEPWFVRYVPKLRFGDREIVESEWNRFADKAILFGDYSLIIDEAHRLQKPQYVNPRLDHFMRQAPRRERNDENPIDIIQTFHRPMDVNGIVLSQADYAYVFRATKMRDLEYLEDEFGEEVSVAAKVLRTPPNGRDVLEVNVEDGSYVLIDNPALWYTDIRKQPVPRSADEKVHHNLEELYG